MDINYVLAAHGVVGKRGGSESVTYESVTNLTSKSIENGAKVLVTWVNPPQTEYVKTELFTSESDLTNVDYATCKANHTKVVDGTLSSYEKIASYGVTYYFKAFVTYITFGEYKVSKGVVTFANAVDVTPPNPITSFVASAGDGKVDLNWVNPTDFDFNKTKIIYKIGSYPTIHTDGTVAYEGSATSTTVLNLTNNLEYYFRAFTFDNLANINNDYAQKISIKPKQINIYGIKIDETNSNPQTSIIRTNGAVGMTPSNFYDVYPFNQIKPCVLKNGVVQYYLNPNDMTKKADGSAADITSGADGDIMIEFPKIWWKIERIGNDLFIKYADAKVDATWDCLAHKRGETEKDFSYIGRYLGQSLSGKLRSLSGKTPTTNKAIGAFRTEAQANGLGYDMTMYYQLLMLKVLYIVQYANLNSQLMIGTGSATGYTTGGTNTKGMTFGDQLGNQITYLGIEDLWGNYFYNVEGLRYDSNRNILISNDKFNDTGTGYENMGQAVPSDVNAYISKVYGDTKRGFIAQAVTGSESTYYCDNTQINVNNSAYAGYNASSPGGGIFSMRGYPSTAGITSLSARLSYL